MDALGSLTVLSGASRHRLAGTFRNGQLLTARVARHLGENRYVLQFGGTSLTVRAEGHLTSGARLRVRVQWRGSTLLLVRESIEQNAARIAAEAGVDYGTKARNAIAALLRTGLPASPEHVRTIVRFLEQRRREDPSAARLVAILLDKHIEPSGDLVDALLDVLESHGRERGDGRGRNPRDRYAEGEPSDESDPTDQFREQLARQGAPGDYSGHPLQLFNHTIGEHDFWQVLPFRVDRYDWSASGSVRIRRTPSGRIRGFVLDVGSDDESRRCFVEYDGTVGRAVVPDLGEGPDGKARGELEEKLRNVGIEIDDTKIEATFDGFTSAEPYEPGAVDTYI